mmetsp:Transcript_62133/g.178773  ORF Transcript_62133/g.178773 Transcript_62133/m.178773 type:complete len:215 (+) Transcript_62133:63-707(+)
MPPPVVARYEGNPEAEAAVDAVYAAPKQAEFAKKAQVRRVDKAERLILEVFSQLNTSGSEHLSCQEMRPFADFIGFRGTEALWAVEYQGVCRYLGCDPDVGIDSQSFARLVSDTSKRGCFCSEAELRALLRRTARVHFLVDYCQSFDAMSDISLGGDCDLWSSLLLGKPMPKTPEPRVDCSSVGCGERGCCSSSRHPGRPFDCGSSASAAFTHL